MRKRKIHCIFPPREEDRKYSRAKECFPHRGGRMMGHSQISSCVFHLAKSGRKIRFFVFALSLSILLTGIFVIYHHHSDKWEQEGCAICAVVHHLYANISILGSVLFRTVFLFFLYIVLGHVSVHVWGFCSHETRGPPNLS